MSKTLEREKKTAEGTETEQLVKTFYSIYTTLKARRNGIGYVGSSL